ncbi:hypothetical protein BDB00DRAFT_865479 [Zychaea mexicana]|uniref:uncharacterized protein n=1 Tax=Zychaea mexicana TaxID=64656 RepID=UPI0022FE9D0C|nr:uncharacterized protein BDB00DRAFT_865479 [Zychaea mexicana]KAI9466537.1 hypothetical protein BDB00DRAFT_865479 [Zychaea mexicana]
MSSLLPPSYGMASSAQPKTPSVISMDASTNSLAHGTQGAFMASIPNLTQIMAQENTLQSLHLRANNSLGATKAMFSPVPSMSPSVHPSPSSIVSARHNIEQSLGQSASRQQMEIDSLVATAEVRAAKDDKAHFKDLLETFKHCCMNELVKDHVAIDKNSKDHCSTPDKKGLCHKCLSTTHYTTNCPAKKLRNLPKETCFFCWLPQGDPLLHPDRGTMCPEGMRDQIQPFCWAMYRYRGRDLHAEYGTLFKDDVDFATWLQAAPSSSRKSFKVRNNGTDVYLTFLGEYRKYVQS